MSSDPRLVRLVLASLVENAIKFTERGRVSVSIERTGETFRLSVSDTGPGIPPEARARIFEPFEHLEQVSDKHVPGMGLGLALAREMADVLGGRIELTSEAGAGTTFGVTLPAALRAPERNRPSS